MANDIRCLGGVNVCKAFAQTVRSVHFLDSKLKEFFIETGGLFPETRVLSQALDEDTLGRIVDKPDLDLKSYHPVKEWTLQRNNKLKSRKATRPNASAKGPDDTVYGVDGAQPAAEQTASQPAAASAAGPWHGAAAASDPWAASPGPPGEGEAATAWPPLSPEWPGGDLDAFGKGKGKGAGSGQPRGPLECWNWFGEGHPSFAFPLAKGAGKGSAAPICGNCKGKGNTAEVCTSKGGGKHQPKGGGKDKDKGYGGKAASAWGRGSNRKGKGKGKISEFDNAD